ncbi:NAD(P)(+) transhydrogenase (Re/Si-specific) subunit beta [Pseudactinotalea terrae]|uniref:NAD(P)(+) transhydrogenase (Re/Si-specific) subunit beta n=1 Tax=Pseudactinotalea terrae TaxID=1743262 RepID=UPI0012E1C24A|nr:NAD(P)(+) transhydrogenase (Re/Si-specific) subunit beta [Pseudactinotalea terrae]
MKLLAAPVAALGYLLAAALFILALKGLSAPASARRGNALGALGALVAVAVVMLSTDFAGSNLVIVLVMIAAGLVLAVPAARRVKMTAMPQLVALLNGVGGGAAALIGVIELALPPMIPEGTYGWTAYVPDDVAVATALESSVPSALPALVATAFGIAVGSISFSGSVVTFLKLQGWLTARPLVLPAAPVIMGLTLMTTVALGWAVVASSSVPIAIWLLVVAGFLGVLLVLPVGGADVPIVISLLNAFTGLAVAATGWALDNVLLLVAGTLVGASGTILTLAMATGMGRPVAGILFGALRGGSTAGSTEASERPVRRATAEDVAVTLAYARRVVVVPGYGLAVAQAQHTVAELVDALRGRGVDAVYGIHPVAGRMPGHMNVLLAEANVGYDLLVEAADINPTMPSTDVVLVVGANDVVNPAARTDPSAPIYGMPIIDADAAAQVIFLKRSMRPGFAGIENELLFAPRTQVLFGDAKTSLAAVLAAVKTV